MSITAESPIGMLSPYLPQEHLCNNSLENTIPNNVLMTLSKLQKPFLKGLMWSINRVVYQNIVN